MTNCTKIININDGCKEHEGVCKTILLTPTKIAVFNGKSIAGVCRVLDSWRTPFSRKKECRFTHSVLVEKDTIMLSLAIEIKKRRSIFPKKWFDDRCWSLAISSLRDNLLHQNRWTIHRYITSENLSDESLKDFIKTEFPKKALLLDQKEKALLKTNTNKHAVKNIFNTGLRLKNCFSRCFSGQLAS